MFTFIQTIEGLDFSGALKFLADKAGVELRGKGSDEKTSDTKKQIYNALESATNFYEEKYQQATAAQHFATRRGITDKSAKHFRIGYAPDDWRQLYDALKSQYSDDILLQAGLIKQKNSSTYDLFRDRLMFPLRDIAGRVVGFSGRRLDGEKAAKYINSPESPVFKKSEVLFGLYEGRNDIRKLDFVILVEGQIDLVLSHQVGFPNTLASSGTAFTTGHLNKIKRYTDNLLLGFDSDSAGIKAAVKVAESAYHSDMTVKTVILPDDSDPADVICSDKERWGDLIKQSVSFPQHLTTLAKAKSRNLDHFNTTLTKVIVPLVSSIESPIKRASQIELVAESAQIAESLVLTEVERHLTQRQGRATSNSNSANSSATVNTQDRSTIRQPKEVLLSDIAVKRHWLGHHYPDLKLPELPIDETDLPTIDTAKILSRDFGDDKTALQSLQFDIIAYTKWIQLDILENRRDEISSKSNKTIEEINELNDLNSQIEDLRRTGL